MPEQDDRIIDEETPDWIGLGDGMMFLARRETRITLALFRIEDGHRHTLKFELSKTEAMKLSASLLDHASKLCRASGSAKDRASKVQ